MQFLVILQLTHQHTDPIIKAILNGVTTIFTIFTIHSLFSIFKEFAYGDVERAKTRAINFIMGCTIFVCLVVGKDDITQIISTSDTKKFTETFMMLITIIMSIIIGGFIGSFIEKKTVKYESIFEVIPVSEDGINEKYTLVEKRFIFHSLFGKSLFKRKISLQKIRSFDFLEDASEALAEIQSKDNLKPKIANG